MHLSKYPGNYTVEWASNGQRAGAWLLLTWPSPITVSYIILYDRPNLNVSPCTALVSLKRPIIFTLQDQVTSGTLTLSDGTTYPVGALPNDASTGGAVGVPNLQTTSILFTVGSVSSTTQNIGLSEIVVLGPSGSPITTSSSAATSTLSTSTSSFPSSSNSTATTISSMSRSSTTSLSSATGKTTTTASSSTSGPQLARKRMRRVPFRVRI